MKKLSLQLVDTIGGTVAIKTTGRNAWTVTQHNYGQEHDNNQNPTWLRIVNPGRAASVTIAIRWATFHWMGYHEIGYVKQSETYAVIRGRITPSSTVYTFDVPSGESFFGAFPWYSNDDNRQCLDALCRESPQCTIRSIGRSGDGRAIECLTVTGEPRRAGKRNVVVIGREHATEPSGSYAVVGGAKYLLSGRAPAEFLKRYNFHFLPIVNPDGTARGLKLTRPGTVATNDMLQGGLTSVDPSVKALRNEVMALRPACLIMHHCYLLSTPWLGVFDKTLGLSLLNQLLPLDTNSEETWSVRKSGEEKKLLRGYCHKHFKSTVVTTELPWAGRLPKDLEKQGADVLRATVMADMNIRNVRLARKS